MAKYLFVCFILFFLMACGNNAVDVKTEAETVPPQYFYYPRANVYFDSANKDYLFLASDDTTWQTTKQIPAVMQALLDKSVQIQNPATPVWQDNNNHRLIYSALLYATPNDTAATKPASKPVVKSKPAIDSSKLMRKEKKGLGKFLDKIFGNKKKEKVKEEMQ